MMRIVNIVFFLAVIGAATWTYQIKHDAEAQLSEIRSLEKQIETNKEMIDVLSADWAFLTQPARIQVLVERFGETLGLDVTTADQIATFDALPGEPVRDASQGIEEIIVQDNLGLENVDGLATGAINGEAQ